MKSYHENEVIVINDKNVTFEFENGEIYSNSKIMAEVFEKRHDDVLKIINSLPKDNFTDRNFAVSEYKDGSGKSNKMYKMTRKGYSFVGMRFTGAKAYQFQVAYIEAFEQMEKMLRGDVATNDGIIAFKRKPGPLKPWEIEIIITHHKKNWGTSQIAPLVGCSESTVTRHVNKYKEQNNKKGIENG